jgi:HPt (histidine-containing phosphotransfer) domain-containing protein
MSPTILTEEDVSVDVTMLYDIAGNDDAYIRMMVYTFLDNLPGTVGKIKDYHDQEDWDSLYKAAHYAKSSLSIIRISDLYAVAQKIETSAKTRTGLSVLAELVGLMDRQCTVAAKLLMQHFPPVTGQHTTA